MMRDDASGGWLPMGGGGLSNVAVRRRRLHRECLDDNEDSRRVCRHEYLIHGRRISDQRHLESEPEVVLSCTIKRDFEYNKVMPTFHHWKTGNKKFGLTFQTAADARAFDRGVRMAMQDLLDADSLACPHKHQSDVSEDNVTHPGVTESSRLQQYNLDVGDDDVFVQLTLPMDKSPSPREPSSTSSHLARPISTSPSSTNATLAPTAPQPGSVPNASSVSTVFPVATMSPAKASTTPLSSSTSALPWTSAAEEQQLEHEQKALLDPEQQKVLAMDKEYSYVHCLVTSPKSSFLSTTATTRTTLPAMTTSSSHDYAYPRLSVVSSGGVRKASSPATSVKQLGDVVCLVSESNSAFNNNNNNNNNVETTSNSNNNGHMQKNLALGSSRLALCVHCGEHFELDSNHRGSCRFGPDCCRGCLERVSCMPCAECTLYHCLSDAEGDHASPCDCGNDDGLRSRRWTLLTLLAIVAPCLCLYPPLFACHRAAKACHVCGSRHVAAQRE